jgi:hypothetical protein
VVPFPAGWNNASAATSGPLTNAYQDLTNSNTVEYQTTTPASPDPNFQNYDFPFTDLWNVNATSASLTPAGPTGYADIDAVITQLFYYTNTMHDYLLGFGFDGPSGNFEGADPVLAEATDGWEDGVAANCPDDSDPDPDPELCRNNANFATPGDGTSPRMQMYMFTSPWRDGSLDGDVIAHEYGHGLSNRLVGGGSLGSGVQTGAMGEGWGDFLSLSKWDDTIVGEYVTGNATTGIRNFAYDNSPLEYSDLCNVGSGCEVHNDGEIWAVTLFDMRAALIARYGNPGKDEAMQLVVDGMKATGSSPDYLDARDGILAADLAGNSGDNQCLIWGAFAGREMGFSASTSGTNDMSPTTATDGPSSCTPTADIGGPYNTIEGTDAALDASASLNPGDPATGPLTYAWDLDNDGAFDDATGQSPAFQLVGQDGVYPIGLRVTNEYGFTDTDSTTVTVANVAPTVTIADNGPKAENTAVTVSGVVSDAGWLEDPLTATIDWGDGSGPVALAGVVEKVRPFETITYSEQHTYGDDGLFTVEVCADDDDTTDSCNSTVVTVTNVDPTAVITTPTSAINGVDTIIAHEGQLILFSADSFDPGSDDRTTTWNWDDGPPAPDSTKVSLNDTVPPLLPDPDPSPEINPRTVTDSEPHAFGDACFYQVVFGASDDDLGTASDTVTVIIAGNESKTKSSGYWQTQYRPRPTALPEARRLCYLQIVGFMSTVFDEARDASTVAHAFDVLSLAGNGGSEHQKLDRELLTAWLNFANGGIEYGQLFDGVPFSTVLATAEAVRLNPALTEAQLKEQRQILQHLNG